MLSSLDAASGFWQIPLLLANSAGLKLNKEKCSLRQSQLRFLGHLIDQSGVNPNPKKVGAIQQMPPPRNMRELKRVLRMINCLGRFAPALATVGQPLYEVLKSKNTWSNQLLKTLKRC